MNMTPHHLATAILAIFLAILLFAAIEYNNRLKCVEKDIANRAIICRVTYPDPPPPPPPQSLRFAAPRNH